MFSLAACIALQGEVSGRFKRRAWSLDAPDLFIADNELSPACTSLMREFVCRPSIMRMHAHERACTSMRVCLYARAGGQIGD